MKKKKEGGKEEERKEERKDGSGEYSAFVVSPFIMFEFLAVK